MATLVWVVGLSCATQPSVLPPGLLAGAAAKITRDICLYPLDTLKARQQVALLREGPTQASTPGLYNGLGSALAVGVPAGTAYLWIGDAMQDRGLNGALAGAAASIAHWTLRTPGEVIKTLIQTASERGDDGPADGLSRAKDVLQTQGPSGLYRGYVWTLLRSLPFDAIRFSLLPIITQAAEEAGHWSPAASMLVGGFGASAVAAILTQPLDVMRTLATVSEGTSGAENPARTELTPWEQLVGQVRRKGVGILYAGCLQRATIASCSGAIYFSAFTYVKHLLQLETG